MSSTSAGSGTRRRIKLRRRDCSRLTTSEICSSCSRAMCPTIATSLKTVDELQVRILYESGQRIFSEIDRRAQHVKIIASLALLVLPVVAFPPCSTTAQDDKEKSPAYLEAWETRDLGVRV